MGLMTILSDNPSYISTMSPTDFGFEVHFKLIEPFLASMKNRGIAPKDGIHLFNQIGLIAYGGAVEAVRQREFEFKDETMSIVARRQYARLDPKDFPLMGEVMDEYTKTPEAKTLALMTSAFQSFARNLGEDDNGLFKDEK